MIVCMKDLKSSINKGILEDIGFFFEKVNDRALYKLGLRDSYDNEGVEALREDVEYFHPQITLDDRMRYIAENIVSNKTESVYNIICNTIISHFYGARGIHQIMTRDPNPKTALVDFERLAVDDDYLWELNKNLEDARELGLPIYGTTELRTSLWGASNKYCAKLFGEATKDPINMAVWIAGFIERGIIDKMYDAKSLKEMYKIITSIEGVGAYYGYHCSTSNSVNPEIMVNHDEKFCVPGPGARYTLDLLFGKDCKVDYGERVIWFRENQKELIGELDLHPSTYNFIVDGEKILQDEQDDLKVYGCEVGLCQYGVFYRLDNNPKLINRRKVARADDELLSEFFGKDIPVGSESKKVTTRFECVCDVDGTGIIVDVIEMLGKKEFTHNEVAKVIKQNGGYGLKQEGNWKQSWQIMQAMVEAGDLTKVGRRYVKNYAK